jgi:hypothetical protein
VTLNYNADRLAKLVNPNHVSEDTPGTTTDEKKRNFSLTLNQRLFAAEPTAVLHCMVTESEVPIVNTARGLGSDQSVFPFHT